MATKPDHELAELETVDVDAVEILSAGGPYYGTGSPPEGDTFDAAFLTELADANNALAGQIKVPIKIGHSKAQKLLRNSGLSASDLSSDEQPAAGWMESFRVVGDKLVADAKSVPRKIADLMKVDAFRSRSVEMASVVEQTPEGEGRTFDSVVTALALLGAKAPAVRTLDDILAWYAEATEATEVSSARELLLDDEEAEDGTVEREYAVGDVVWDPEFGSTDISNDLCEALNGPETSDVSTPRWWVRDVSTSNRTALVSKGYDDDSGWVVPYTLDDSGEPVPSPMSEWTLASQAWLQATPAQVVEEAAEAGLALSASGADTSTMTETTTAPELTDEKIVEFAAALGIEEEDAAKRRESVLSKFAEFSGSTSKETPPDPVKPAAAATEAETAETETDDPRIAALEARAALGERAFEERRTERRDANIRVAIEQGRIDPADKVKWTRFFDDNEELAMEALLSIPQAPRGRAFGSDDPGRVELAETVGKGYDAAYGNLAGQLGFSPHTLAADGGQS